MTALWDKWTQAGFLAGRVWGLLLLPAGSGALLFFYLSGVVGADVPETQNAEVQHLIDYLKTSGCEMERNGSRHDAEEAVKHIQKKYDYYRDDIKTTEDFIEKSASQSMLSGSKYRVHCPGGKVRLTADWLMEELERYRKEQRGL